MTPGGAIPRGLTQIRYSAREGSTMAEGRERNIGVPSELDAGKLAEVALALLSLTLHDGRVWKALDWDWMNLLHEKGWIADPVSRTKSVIMTAEGGRTRQIDPHGHSSNHLYGCFRFVLVRRDLVSEAMNLSRGSRLERAAIGRRSE